MSSRNLPNCHCERSVAISSPQHRPLPQAVASPAPPPLQVVRPHREPPNVIGSRPMSSRNLPNCHCERSVAISSRHHRPLPHTVASPAPPPLHIVRPLREPPNVIAKPAQLSLRAQRGNLVAAAPTLPASRRITPPHPPTTLAEKLLTSTPSANERPYYILYTSQTGGPQPDVETSYTLRRRSPRRQGTTGPPV